MAAIVQPLQPPKRPAFAKQGIMRISVAAKAAAADFKSGGGEAAGGEGIYGDTIGGNYTGMRAFMKPSRRSITFFATGNGRDKVCRSRPRFLPVSAADPALCLCQWASC